MEGQNIRSAQSCQLQPQLHPAKQQRSKPEKDKVDSATSSSHKGSHKRFHDQASKRQTAGQKISWTQSTFPKGSDQIDTRLPEKSYHKRYPDTRQQFTSDPQGSSGMQGDHIHRRSHSHSLPRGVKRSHDEVLHQRMRSCNPDGHGNVPKRDYPHGSTSHMSSGHLHYQNHKPAKQAGHYPGRLKTQLTASQQMHRHDPWPVQKEYLEDVRPQRHNHDQSSNHIRDQRYRQQTNPQNYHQHYHRNQGSGRSHSYRGSLDAEELADGQRGPQYIQQPTWFGARESHKYQPYLQGSSRHSSSRWARECDNQVQWSYPLHSRERKPSVFSRLN